jgi:predicted dehydrogenase
MTDLSRRSFVQLAAAGIAAAAPNDKVRMGFIGVGRQGTSRLNEFLRQPDVVAVAVCDVDATHVDQAAEIVAKVQGAAPAKFRDFRKLLGRKDVDAVMIATPDHWHALPAIHACQAGKDVFVEKPLSYSIGEGRAMVAAARKHERVTQMGNHIHNDRPTYRRVVEVIKSGALGKIHRVDCALASTATIGRQPDSTPPPELDYDFWLGPAPKRPYNPLRSHFTYRYFWDYSGGALIDFWCHYTDVVHWALGLGAPQTVSAAGGRWTADDLAETPDIIDVVCQYPNLLLTWSVHPNGRPGFDHMGSSVIFEGSAATLVTNYNRFEVYVKGKREEAFKPPAPSIPESPGHIREFLDAVKSRKRTSCDIEYGHLVTKGGLLANIAYRIGERLTWDDIHEHFTGHTQANRYITRQYRRPWKI